MHAPRTVATATVERVIAAKAADGVAPVAGERARRSPLREHAARLNRIA
jgi:hypothetical protein